jgi:serine protease Do
MKVMKALGIVVVVAGLGILTVYAQERREALPRVHEMAVLAGRGVEIGASVRDIEASDAQKQNTTGGVRLEDVRPDSPAARAGLKKSDVIVAFDGEHVRSARQFSRLVRESAPGRTVTATIVRDGKRSDVQITPSENREAFTWDDDGRLGDRIRERLGDFGAFADRMAALDFNFDYPSRLSRGHLGVTVETLSSQLATYFGAADGVLVTAVSDGSPAAHAGIRAGDVITSIDGDPVRSSEELMRKLDGVQRDVSLGVVRDKKETTIRVVESR